MKRSIATVKLSQEQITLAAKLEVSPDPMERINGGYYEIKKNLILVDYFKMMEDAKTEPDRIEAQDVLDQSMETLHHAYLSDLKSELVLHFGVHAIHFEITQTANSLFL